MNSSSLSYPIQRPSLRLNFAWTLIGNLVYAGSQWLLLVLLAKFKGIHKGEWLGMAPTNKEVSYTFAVGYEIRNNKIVHSWLVADNLAIIEQLKGSLLKV